MNTKHYQLRISGLSEDSGEIRATTLVEVVEALRVIAERSMRLLATGTGSTKGAKPKWLEEATDFSITGLHAGSTVLEIQAEKLGEVAHNQFGQKKLFGQQPNIDDTALDLAASSINEAQEENPSGEYFDTSVLEAIDKFCKTAQQGVQFELVSEGNAKGHFALDAEKSSYINKKLLNIPAPQVSIISGTLDQIRYGDGLFSVAIDEKTSIKGQLKSDLVDTEILRPLWGKLVTTQGKVHFKMSGQPRFIEAQRIWKKNKGDDVFQKMPTGKTNVSDTLFELRLSTAKSFDLEKLVGAWPGDEPIEELLAELD